MCILTVSATPFAVDMLARGATPYDVAKLLGDEIATVEKHYAAFVRELRERVRNLMETGKGIHAFGPQNTVLRILTPKSTHSDCLVGIQEVGDSKPLARPLFLSYPQSFTLLLPMPIFEQFSVHSVQLRATRTQIRTVLPTFYGTHVLFDLVVEITHVAPRMTHPIFV